MNGTPADDITQFLYREAWLLDHRRYREWLGLLADDLVYRMPVRVTAERREGSDLREDMAYFEETKASLAKRVDRLYVRSAWIEEPPARVRRFVTNVQVEPTDRDGEWQATSYVQVLRSPGSDATVEQIFGERVDRLRRTPAGWQICARTIYPDQAVLTVRNLGLFL